MLTLRNFCVSTSFARNIIKGSADWLSTRACSRLSCTPRRNRPSHEKDTSPFSSLSQLECKLIIPWQATNLPVLPTKLQKISPGVPGKVLDLPQSSLLSIILDMPGLQVVVPDESPVPSSKKAPSTSQEDKQAARLIVIRRRKMKKHQLRKLRKRMKYEWAKVRQRRELRKEKRFQAGLLALVQDAEKFDAEAYVKKRLHLAKTRPLPKRYKGKYLPAIFIKQLLGVK